MICTGPQRRKSTFCCFLAGLTQRSCVRACRYFKRVDRKGKAREMYPPGPIMFVRPLKHLVRADNGRKSRSGFRIKRTFDAVWITPQELVSEGILVSSMVSPIRHWHRRWWLNGDLGFEWEWLNGEAWMHHVRGGHLIHRAFLTGGKNSKYEPVRTGQHPTQKEHYSRGPKRGPPFVHHAAFPSFAYFHDKHQHNGS